MLREKRGANTQSKTAAVLCLQHQELVLQTGARQGVFALGDARSFSALTSKIPPLGSMQNFDADVKKTTARHQCETLSGVLVHGLVHTGKRHALRLCLQ